ncbi:hypothetical protein M8J76_008131 [Diaphorina citri]|nr:hypothetical protein M8J76_008131 [Diaphorina citri]
MNRVSVLALVVIVLEVICRADGNRGNRTSSYRTRAKAIEDKTDSKNVVQLETKWSRPIIVPEFSPNGDLTLIRFENATKRAKAQKKVNRKEENANQTKLDLPVPTHIAEYMADIINEIPKNTSKNEREKLIIENLFIEILRDDQLKNQLTQVISNVTKNTISKTNVKIGDDEFTTVIARNNKTRSGNKTEGTNGKKRGNIKSNSTSTTAVPTTVRPSAQNGITQVEFNLNRIRGSSKFDSKKEDDDEDEKIEETITTTIRNDIEDEGVTVESDDSENDTRDDSENNESTTPGTTPSIPTTTRRRPEAVIDKNRNNNKKKQPTNTKADLETLDERDSIFWYEQGDSALKGLLERKLNEKKARNVILFLGDGMSLATITAARIYDGQQKGHSGEEAQLSFENFPSTGLSKTYCIDKQVADSACTATAYLSGVKANYGTLGVSGLVTRNDCEAMRNESNHVDTIADWAQDCDKSTGLVTTTRVTHATPAALYAHTANREWESDKHVLKAKLDPRECEDIASQLITRSPGNKLNVIMGGGRANFLPEFAMDDEGHHGKRKDRRDLVDIWKQVKLRQGKSIAYVTNQTDLMKVNTSDTEYLLGLFSSDHLDYALDADPTKQPSLSEMTQVAIEILDKNPEGYFLLVEGGRIDHAHHENMAHKALDETVEFSDAIRKAMDMVDLDETLIVVTADHSHTMTINGYPTRGNDILGLAGISDVDQSPYTTLSYANGPSSKKKDVKRYDFSKDNLKYKNYKYPANFVSNSESHGGEDVPVYSVGPWSHLLSGVFQQNVIPRVMGFASCIGPGGYTACNTGK